MPIAGGIGAAVLVLLFVHSGAVLDHRRRAWCGCPSKARVRAETGGFVDQVLASDGQT